MEISIQGYSTSHRFEMKSAYKMIADAGFGAIDWALDLVWDRKQIKKGIAPTECIYDRPLEEVVAHFKEEIDTIKECGLKIAQAHSPFPCYIKGNPGFTEYCINVYKKVIELCDYADCPYVVIHGASHYHDDEFATQEDIFNLNMHMYEELIPTLLENNVMVLLENLFITYDNTRKYHGTCSDPHEAVKYIDTLNAKAGKEVFGLCLDTGHLNLLHIPCEPYIKVVGKRIKALHIHDNDMMSDAHLSPYTGTFYWADFIRALKSIGYDGDLNFESYQQLSTKRTPDELVMPWLRLMYECGAYFRSQLEG